MTDATTDAAPTFDRWYRASKYCQVVVPREEWRQIALDAWNASYECSAARLSALRDERDSALNQCTDLHRGRTAAEDRERALRENYDELIMAVGKKFPGETRHQTALRYICERERAGWNDTKAALSEPPR